MQPEWMNSLTAKQVDKIVSLYTNTNKAQTLVVQAFDKYQKEKWIVFTYKEGRGWQGTVNVAYKYVLHLPTTDELIIKDK